MSELARVGIAMESTLLARFDGYVERHGYATRSEAVRDLVRDALAKELMVADDSAVIGTVTLVYDHHVRLLTERLNALQHDHHHVVVSTLHAHLNHSMCLEVLVVRGLAKQVRQLADQLIATKGVHHGHFALTAAPEAEPLPGPLLAAEPPDHA